jgi:hypothetical protein
MTDRPLRRIKKRTRELKPLRNFDYKIIGEQLHGLLTNVDRDLRRKSEAFPVSFLDNAPHLLNIFVRCAINSYNAVLYFAGDIPEDPRRKPNFVIAVPPINRQLLDLLFTIVYLLDDYRPRVREYMRSGFRELAEEQHQWKTTFGNNPDYKAHIRNMDQMLIDLARDLEISPDLRRDASRFPYWPHPDKIQELRTKSRPFLRHLNKWFYHDTSAQSHLTFGGLLKISFFFLAEHLGGARQELIERRFLQQFRGQQMSRTMVLTLAIAAEADAFGRLGNNQRIRFIWPVLGDTFVEARELWDSRYEKLTNY